MRATYKIQKAAHRLTKFWKMLKKMATKDRDVHSHHCYFERLTTAIRQQRDIKAFKSARKK